MSTPTKTASFTLDSTGGQDYLQLKTSSGGTPAWIDSTGAPQGALATGGSGTPGGTNTAIQFNNSGSFGGNAAGLLWDDSTLSFQAIGGPNSATNFVVGTTGGNGFSIEGESQGDAVFLAASETNASSITVEASADVIVSSDLGAVKLTDTNNNPVVTATHDTKLSFYNGTPQTKLTVTGSRSANAALASLLTQLAALGLITDGTS